MVSSLSRIADLPPSTLLWVGHEYTLPNLRFAAEVDPTNKAVLAKLSDAQSKAHHRLPTVPSTVGDELQTNPFFRLRQLQQQQEETVVETFARIRAKKDAMTFS